MVELNYGDLMVGASKVPAKISGVAAAAEGIEPLVGSFGDKVVQALGIINQIFSQWTQLTQDPTFQQMVLSRLPEGLMGQGSGAGLGMGAGGGAGLGGNPPSQGLTQEDVIKLIRATGVAVVQDGVKRLGDISIEDLIKVYGPVKLSQLLSSLRGG